ncbi:uncharacterized protein LOC144246242 isoform X1 [Lonchura striata]
MPSKSLGDALKSEVGVQLCLEISREPAGGAEGMENSHREKNMNSQPPRPDGFLQRELGACPQSVTKEKLKESMSDRADSNQSSPMEGSKANCSGPNRAFPLEVYSIPSRSAQTQGMKPTSHGCHPSYDTVTQYHLHIFFA